MVTDNNPALKIGPLLKQYRKGIRLTQSFVAKKTGISSSMLSQIERSLVSSSVSTLFAICNALGMDLKYLIEAITKTEPVRVFHPNERSREDYSHSVFEDLIYKSETPNAAELLLLEIKPKQEIALKGKGKDVVLMGYVIEGSVLILTDDSKNYVWKKGDSVLFKSLIPHSFKNTENTLFRAVLSVSPIRPEFFANA